MINRNIKHGQATRGKHSKEYRAWSAMKDRCERPGHIGYAYYGGRGIKVCERWRNDFTAFFADMGLAPSPQHTVDRYPNLDGDYEPTNCRWATPAEQRANQRPYDESARVLKAWETRSRVSSNRVDLSGRRFNRLVVLGYAETRERRAYWLCRCDCGVETVVAGKSLRQGNTGSCGCYTRDLARERAVIRNKQCNPAISRWRKIKG